MNETKVMAALLRPRGSGRLELREALGNHERRRGLVLHVGAGISDVTTTQPFRFIEAAE